MKNSEKDFKEIQNHLKEMGFIYSGSQIYGGLANTYDYGPLGVILNKNIKDLWWKEFITKEKNVYGLDSKILMNNKVWEASGHISNFSDPLIENKNNGKRYRADHIIEEFDKSIKVESMDKKQMEDFIKSNILKWDNEEANWTDIKEFHLMFETKQGVTEDSKSLVYLRPETAQGIFINFKNVQRSTRAKLPFGIGQIGKSFRNEVTPGNYIFRTREFEQMEIEYFVEEKNADEEYKKYIGKTKNFLNILGIKNESIKIREHSNEELAHYAKATTDIEFLFPFGYGELMGIANRGNFDLKTHMEHSGESLEYLNSETGEKIIPHVIEPSMGLDRLALAVLTEAYEVEELDNDSRVVMRLNKELSPYQVAILPLNKKHHSETAKNVYSKFLEKGIRVTFDESGSIGKRYRRQDSIGTPICLTVIDETKDSDKATIRFRDDMKQIEINMQDLDKYL